MKKILRKIYCFFGIHEIDEYEEIYDEEWDETTGDENIKFTVKGNCTYCNKEIIG